MWDPSTAVLAVAAVSAGAFVLAPVVRLVGGFWAIIGLFGMTTGSDWAPTGATLGVMAWLVDLWSVAVLPWRAVPAPWALVLFDRTPLRPTLPQYHRHRRSERLIVYR